MAAAPSPGHLESCRPQHRSLGQTPGLYSLPPVGPVRTRSRLGLEWPLISSPYPWPPASRGRQPQRQPRAVALCCGSGLLSVPPGVSNEAQFVFTIQSIVMAQKLKGTLSFIAKVCATGTRSSWVSGQRCTEPCWHRAPLPCPRGCGPRAREPHAGCAPHSAPLPPPQDADGATHEKLDFRLHFSCSAYLVTTPCYRCGPSCTAEPTRLRLRHGPCRPGSLPRLPPPPVCRGHLPLHDCASPPPLRSTPGRVDEGHLRDSFCLSDFL